MDKKEKVVIKVWGGVVQVVLASTKELNIEIIDYDDLECEKFKDNFIEKNDNLFKIY